MALLSLRGVTLNYGGRAILDGVDLEVERNERICLLGRNGEGKSTLLKVLLGEVTPDSGEVLRQQGVRVSRMIQEVPLDLDRTVGQIVAEGLAEHETDGPIEADDYRVLTIVSQVALDPEARFESLSSGLKRRALLGRALVAEPDVLLLDEPTNHLDVTSIAWLEDFLIRFDGTLLFVTHDRAFLNRLATRILELDRGHLSSYRCDYATYLDRREEERAAEEKQAALFDKRLAQEEVWIRQGIKARRTRNEGRVRALKAMREQRRRRRERQGTAHIQAQEAQRSGTLVIEAEAASVRVGQRTILQDVDATLLRGDKVGIIGPNGAGKTTLLRLLLGELEPEAGEVRHGTNLEVAYFDQLKTTLDDAKTVQENVSEYETITIDGRSRHVIGYLQDFLFEPERARVPVKILSGGERSRVLLARLFTKPSNVLVLDEPTNDLDIETLELLETLLSDYGGTVLLVSHDRAFLDNVVTSTLVIDRDGRVKEYAGGYEDYLVQRKQDEATAAPPTSKTAASTKPKSQPADKPRKLSYKEKKELEALPARIEQLEAERQQIHDAMADPEFYRQPAEAIPQTKARLDALDTELAEAYHRWETLESLE